MGVPICIPAGMIAANNHLRRELIRGTAPDLLRSVLIENVSLREDRTGMIVRNSVEEKGPIERVSEKKKWRKKSIIIRDFRKFL